MSGPLGYQLATSEFFLAPPKKESHMPLKTIATEKKSDFLIFGSLVVVFVK